MADTTLTPQAIASWLGMKLADSTANAEHLEAVVLAVTDTIDALPDAPRLPDDKDGTPGGWAPRTVQAATMLGARLYRRRNSANGIEAIVDGGASYVARWDSDISRMLRIDGYTRPVIG